MFMFFLAFSSHGNEGNTYNRQSREEGVGLIMDMITTVRMQNLTGFPDETFSLYKKRIRSNIFKVSLNGRFSRVFPIF